MGYSIWCSSFSESSKVKRGKDFPIPLESLSSHLVFALVTKSCRTLLQPQECNLPGSSIYGISQARILEWVAISFYRGSSRPRDQTPVSSIAGGFFISEPSWKPFLLPLNSFRKLLFRTHTPIPLVKKKENEVIVDCFVSIVLNTFLC